MSELLGIGKASKMRTKLTSPVAYNLILGDSSIAVNDYIGRHLVLKYEGEIRCTHCDRKTKKSFSQGYCYPCFTRLAQCDSCIMSPEKCHYDQGTCREPEWGEANCMVDHVVYIANSSGLKVGITRGTQTPTRWIDQGAIQALPVLRVATRYQSGLAEVVFKAHAADRTNWRAMLKGDVEELDMLVERERLLDLCAEEIRSLQDSYGLQAIQLASDAEVINIDFPVRTHPDKVKSFNLDKDPVAEGVLEGIKGQYLIFDTGVINIRKYGGYYLSLSAS
ncbi:MAG: hypothetical protein ACI9GW_002985 [Halieaceae bacterium]|jgi:hypothetical protein